MTRAPAAAGRRAPKATAGGAGLRESGKLDKRRRLKDAARAVFVEHGYEAATTREIAARAGVSVGTVFVYAKDKRDLLLLIINDELDAVGARGPAALARPGSLLQRLLAYFRLRYRYWAAEPRLARPALAETLDFAGLGAECGEETQRFHGRGAAVMQQLTQFFAAAQQAGELADDVAAARVAELVFDLYLIEVRRWLSSDAPRLADGMARLQAVLALFLRGVLRSAAG